MKGFLKHEIEKESIPIINIEPNYSAPLPREMIDLEVNIVLSCTDTLFVILEIIIKVTIQLHWYF